jgi:uncharacterized membrane protein YcaP (DUF421 family)
LPYSNNNTTISSIIPDNFVETAFNTDYDLIISVIFRTVIVTVLILFIVRWLGNKGLGQLTTFELLIVVGLGSAIGDPMIYISEMSIPQAITSVVIVVILFKLLDYITMKSKKFSKLTVPNAILLVKDGKYVEGGLKKAKIDEREFESYMRIPGVEYVSDVRLSYLEVNGQVSIIKRDTTNG